MIDSKEKKDVRQTREFLVRQWRAEQYALKMNLPVPVLAESTVTRSASANESVNVSDGEARESLQDITDSVTKSDSSGGQTFDKKAYQREYMRKRRRGEL